MTPPAPARVLFLGHGAERTGPPTYLAHLLDRLPALGAVEPHVVLARGGPLVERYRSAGATVTVAARGREPLEPLAAALRRAGAPGAARGAAHRWLRARLARTARPDLVYVNTVSPATLDLLAALPRHHAPVLVHVHEMGLGLAACGADRWRPVLDAAHGVAVVSEAVADVLEAAGVDRGRLHLAPGFVDAADIGARAAAVDRGAGRARLGIDEATVAVGSLGLPDRRKAPGHLLRAVWHLRRARPDLDLAVVWIGGDPASDDGRRLADEAARLGLDDRLHHVSHTDDPVPALAALDVFALPSREDAFPLALLEAAAAGLPLVTFASGGSTELVDRTVGRVVAYPDVVALASALAELADDPGLRRRLGAAAAARVVERHDVAAGAARAWAPAAHLLETRW